jgi:deazaflavin-dependent oxidoreductase (nitroreductase family)
VSGTAASSDPASAAGATHNPNPNPEHARGRNLFLRSPTGGRVLSALTLPGFTLHPPLGYGVLITTGRRSGKTRRRCIHAVRHGQRAYIVMIRPTPAAIAAMHTAAWMWNIRADPNVRLRLRGGSFAGRARELSDESELQSAREIYCETVNPFDYVECAFHRGGWPTRAKIIALHRSWFDSGIPLVVELHNEL